MAGLMDHRVNAQIKDLDHYRIHGGMAVETDYIIQVTCEKTGKKTRPEPDFETFYISKTFSAFRTLCDQLHDSADAFMSTGTHSKLPAETRQKVKKLAQYCEVVMQLIDSQRTQYLGKVRFWMNKKWLLVLQEWIVCLLGDHDPGSLLNNVLYKQVNYLYVKVLSKQRSQIITEVLEATVSSFPNEIESHPFLAEVAKRVEAFFLTDHCASVGDEGPEEDTNISSMFTPIKKNYQHVESKITAAAKAVKAASNSAREATSSAFKAASGNAPPALTLERRVSSPVVPMTRKIRRSRETRDLDEKDLRATA